ncbi:MAG: molybdate ABC transporter substrate-binding protein [Anaerolineae bacterium]
MIRRALIVAVVAFALILSVPIQGQGSDTLTVFAAASLTDAFEEIAQSFEAAHPGVDVVFNFGNSSTLATQLVEGAPADVFASANNTQMTVARDGGRIGGPVHTFAKNRLVLIVPADNPANIQSLHDLANPGIQLVLVAPGAPVRDYTDSMLTRLATDPGYGETFSSAVMANLVSEEDNVRQVTAKVALGEADAGIVYVSDVTPDIRDQVQVLHIPDAYNTLATYPIALTNDTAAPDLAQAFVDAVLSADGQSVLENWGFISIAIPEQPSTVQLSTVEGSFTVDGQVYNPLTLDVEALQAFTPHTETVTYLSGQDTVTTTFTGALLWDVLSAAQPNLNGDVRNDKLSMVLVITGADGTQAVVSWGEIDPEYANAPVLLAYAENDAPLAEGQGPVRLVVPTDARGGRYISAISNVSLRDAPPVSR